MQKCEHKRKTKKKKRRHTHLQENEIKFSAENEKKLREKIALRWKNHSVGTVLVDVWS